MAKWRRIRKSETARIETLLLNHENLCINICNRYINQKYFNSKVWALHDNSTEISALVLYSNQNLMPLLCGQKKIPPLKFLFRFFGNTPIHSIQGIREDVITMEASLEKHGLSAAEKIDYDLMCIDSLPSGNNSAGHPGLIIRKANLFDIDDLAVLQAAYEQEEVLPSAKEFNHVLSRLNTERILKNEQVFLAELGGSIIGKINTNACSFTRFQIGGVYVHPDYRGLGIAKKMAGEFVTSLIKQGRSISLFVKKTNPAAFCVYRNIGFKTKGDYRICYF